LFIVLKTFLKYLFTKYPSRTTMPDRHILFHKPYNVLCQFTPEGMERLTLKDYIDVPGVYAIGRLDQDSEGLLLLTNNGRVQHQLSDPKFAHAKTYWVQVEGIPDEAALQKLRQGVTIQNYRTRPAQVRSLDGEPDLPPRHPPIRVRKAIPTAWILTEGKNRQVRRMTAAVGFPTLRLVRVAIAHLRLDGLEPGEWRSVSGEEIRSLLVKAMP
jgi:23S rRNA pseudouridine2457 synthase